MRVRGLGVAVFALAGCGASRAAAPVPVAPPLACPACDPARRVERVARAEPSAADAPASIESTPAGLIVRRAGQTCALAPWLGPGASAVRPEIAGGVALLHVAGPRVMAVALDTCSLAWERGEASLVHVADGAAWLWTGATSATGAVGHLRLLALRTGEERARREFALQPRAGGGPPVAPRVAFFTAVRDGRVVVAARCARAGSARCASWVGAFDEASAQPRWSTQTSEELPIVSASARGVAVETAGAVEVRAWETGSVVARFSLGARASSGGLGDDGTYVWNDSVLHARGDDGVERWSIPGAWFLGFAGADVLATTLDDARVVDGRTGATRCRRMIVQPSSSPPADPSAYARALCDGATRVRARLEGAVFVDGAPGARVRLRVGDQLVTTNERGRFRATFDAGGRVRVQHVDETLPTARGRRCVTTMDDVRVDLPEDGRAAYALVELATERPRCFGGCGDCR